MATYMIECKNCGAQNLCEEGKQVLACAHCESLLTVARSFDTRGGLFNRANYLRRNSEFDKALAAYEEILRGDNTEYEAHWGIVLCRYGIEYVEDPATGKRVPTCHRTQYDSILNDAEYMAACEYAPQDVKTVYEEEAAYINKVQKDILALAQKQEQFDVFLCYKETDADGNRSQDSVLAQELEFELTKRGYKVFFARKTLAGKLGTAYEPVIFSALHSARVMVVLGTKPENFSAVWVKNEWSRYRELIKKGEDKTLIPAYRSMSPYDLPGEFADLQALDMGKLGFVQDLCDGIDRLARAVKQQPIGNAVMSSPASPGVISLMRRAQLFMEDGDFKSAGEYIEKVLDIDPEYAPAYIGKLMVELMLKDEKQLAEQEKPLEGYSNFQKALRFADAAQKQKYEEYNRAIKVRATEFERIAADFTIKLARITKEKSTLMDEYDQIGLFGGKRKEEIRRQIEEADIKKNELLQKGPTSLLWKNKTKVKIDDTIYFGTYMQRSTENNTKSEISWRVLSIENGKALLISKKNLLSKPYNTKFKAITWETCTLRAWLNNDFLNTAFTAQEQASIALTAVKNANNPDYRTNGGNNTTDRIFLLSLDEANKYFANNAAREGQNTAYAEQMGAHDSNSHGWWWLRSPGYSTDRAAGVCTVGSLDSLDSFGSDVSLGVRAVRPALFLNLGS